MSFIDDGYEVYGSGRINIREFGDYASGMLKRFRIGKGQVADQNDLRQAMLKNWDHKYSPTNRQVEAMFDQLKLDKALKEVEPVKPTQYYQTTRSGRQIPRLASKGIRRITYQTRGGGRQTRYIVPGRRGFYSLGRAREIFSGI